MRLLAFLLLAVLTGGCDLKQREESLEEREKAVIEKEKQLLLYENSLYLWEKKLETREQLLNDSLITDTVNVKDSVRVTDSTYIIDSAIVGVWNVSMTCTQTSCAGFAVGDTKAEKWQFSYSGKELVVKAMVNNEIVRVYNGFTTSNNIELVQSETGTTTPSVVNMTVRIHRVNEGELEGERVIIRENNCKVVFDLRFRKVNE